MTQTYGTASQNFNFSSIEYNSKLDAKPALLSLYTEQLKFYVALEIWLNTVFEWENLQASHRMAGGQQEEEEECEDCKLQTILRVNPNFELSSVWDILTEP